MTTIKVKFEDLPKHRKAPILNYCRVLLKEGHPPETRLEIYRHREEPDIICPSIGESAKWTIEENEWVGPRFKKYIPFPSF
jgi:hypothetical protein